MKNRKGFRKGAGGGGGRSPGRSGCEGGARCAQNCEAGDGPCGGSPASAPPPLTPRPRPRPRPPSPCVSGPVSSLHKARWACSALRPRVGGRGLAVGTALAVVMTVVVLSMDQEEGEHRRPFRKDWAQMGGGRPSQVAAVGGGAGVLRVWFAGPSPRRSQEIPGEGLAEPPLRRVTKPRCWPDLPSVPAVSW